MAGIIDLTSALVGGKLGWGYVCDDMFSSVAATVACRQLGYLSGKMGVALALTLDLDPQDRKRSFVLDDVRCKEGDANLISCDHLPLGVHNCGLSETVKVKCSR
ncbi:hypothetical protein RRG08_006560 [Elysia crispata]|uniref:SRCR domain-containing protein n=1 Tax=Elysia crispata TaxID=231223 RepID=A0AAE0ZB60_9GAST|nr:hypothetical protein RRG08_006560 [Elysia crispata]